MLANMVVPAPAKLKELSAGLPKENPPELLPPARDAKDATLFPAERSTPADGAVLDVGLPKIELLAKQSGRKIEIATHREVALANLCDPLPNSVSGDLNGLLMYTSGTTGRPKGVLLSQSSLLAGGQNAALAHQLGADDCGLCVLTINQFLV